MESDLIVKNIQNRYTFGVGARSFVYAVWAFNLFGGIYDSIGNITHTRRKKNNLYRELAFLEKLSTQARGRPSCLETDD